MRINKISLPFFAGVTDYIPLQMTLTASSAGPQTVMIQLVNDSILEDPESFNVTLFSTDSRVSIQQNVTTVFISDDDGMIRTPMCTAVMYAGQLLHSPPPTCQSHTPT